MLSLYHVTRLVFPGTELPLRVFLRSNGIDASLVTGDRGTPHGWALWVASRYVREYVERSGWNANGLMMRMSTTTQFPYTGRLPKPFTDTTGYSPVNPGHLPPDRLRYPLRWQPLTQMVDRVAGDWATQVHVTPHIGKVVKPLSFNASEWLLLRVRRPPYKRPNSYRHVSKRDLVTLKRKLVPHMLRRMRNVYTGWKNAVKRKLFRIHWWDNKFVSLGGIGVAYDQFANISRDNVLVTGLGEMMAIHDAILLAFKEKVAHDVARPETIMRHLYYKERIPNPRNSSSSSDGSMMAVEEFEPFIRTMPHSEFPSASAVLCTALTTYVERQVAWRTNGTFVDKGYDAYFPEDVFPFFPEGLRGDVRVKFRSIRALARDCGASRVAAGLHFQPAVDEGNRLGRIVGQKTFETFRDLEEGRVPKNCHWCLRT